MPVFVDLVLTIITEKERANPMAIEKTEKGTGYFSKSKKGDRHHSEMEPVPSVTGPE